MLGDDRRMLELRLHSGQIVTFDGRILEVFAPDGAAERAHIAHIEAGHATDPDGTSVVTVAGCSVEFGAAEATARDRLLAAIADAQLADAQLDARVRR